jgi:hypothetical protein
MTSEKEGIKGAQSLTVTHIFLSSKPQIIHLSKEAVPVKDRGI